MTRQLILWWAEAQGQGGKAEGKGGERAAGGLEMEEWMVRE